VTAALLCGPVPQVDTLKGMEDSERQVEYSEAFVLDDMAAVIALCKSVQRWKSLLLENTSQHRRLMIFWADGFLPCAAAVVQC
jgi:hypothetical protein